MLEFFNITKSGTQKVEGLNTWVVSWEKRYGKFAEETEKCYQAFSDKDEAMKLKIALEDAFKLIGTTHGSKVELKKQKTGI